VCFDRVIENTSGSFRTGNAVGTRADRPVFLKLFRVFPNVNECFCFKTIRLWARKFYSAIEIFEDIKQSLARGLYQLLFRIGARAIFSSLLGAELRTDSRERRKSSLEAMPINKLNWRRAHDFEDIIIPKRNSTNLISPRTWSISWSWVCAVVRNFSCSYNARTSDKKF